MMTEFIKKVEETTNGTKWLTFACYVLFWVVLTLWRLS